MLKLGTSHNWVVRRVHHGSSKATSGSFAVPRVFPFTVFPITDGLAHGRKTFCSPDPYVKAHAEQRETEESSGIEGANHEFQ